MEISSEKIQTEEFLNLLLKFGELPHPKQDPTFMEVSGYPQYENVCSNILKFYLDPSQQHGLKDLFISAILRITNNDCSTNVQSVSREFHTARGKIDLLIEGDEFILAIENKIFHWLANDLDDYAKAVSLKSNDSQRKIKIVLGLSEIKNPKSLRGGFISCTYAQLWKEVTGLLGLYISKANPKWVTYLLDFIETTTNLAGENMELKKVDQFFIENDEIISSFLKERNAFLKRLTQKVAILCELIKEVPEANLLTTNPYTYSTDRLVMDFKFQNTQEIAFDLYLRPSGWSLELFGRGVPSYYYLLELIKQPSLNEKMREVVPNQKRYYVQKWLIDTDLAVIRDEVCKWLTAVNEANRALVEYQLNDAA